MTPMLILFPTLAAALAAATFFIEGEGIGCWVQSDDPAVLAQGEALKSRSYALHIPSQTRERAPLPPGQIEIFKATARAIGLDQVSQLPASGLWKVTFCSKSRYASPGPLSRLMSRGCGIWRGACWQKAARRRWPSKWLAGWK